VETSVRGKRSWTYIESSNFQSARAAYLSDVELEALKELIPRHPDRWIALKHGAGLFAIHWGVKTPFTIVFAIAPEVRKVYLLEIEPGKHYSVTEEVRKALGTWIRRLEKLGVRIAVWYGVKQLVKWILDHWPW
jgi:hypothetical protein